MWNAYCVFELEGTQIFITMQVDIRGLQIEICINFHKQFPISRQFSLVNKMLCSFWLEIECAKG